MQHWFLTICWQSDIPPNKMYFFMETTYSIDIRADNRIESGTGKMRADGVEIQREMMKGQFQVPKIRIGDEVVGEGD